MFQRLLTVAATINYFTVSAGCEWRMEYAAGATQFKYYSSCNDTQYMTIRVTSAIEYNSTEIPTVNAIIFSKYLQKWNWAGMGESFSYQGYNCLKNTYSAMLGSIFSNNCLFNITTYLFQEAAMLDVYDGTSRFLNQYSLKWDLNIIDWPWKSSANHVDVCMLVQTNTGLEDQFEDEYSINMTFGHSKILFSIPKLVSCNGIVTGNITVDSDGEMDHTLINVCIHIPYCNGDIYYDPIVWNDYKYPRQELSNVVIVVIVIGVLVGLVIFGLLIRHFFNKKLDSYYEMSQMPVIELLGKKKNNGLQL